MIEVRCSQCGRKLLELDGQAKISIKCPKCKSIITIDANKKPSNFKKTEVFK